MQPIITIGEIKLWVFPFVFIIAVYVCLIILLTSKKYDTSYFTDIISVMPYALVSALIGGKILYFVTRIFSGYTIMLELVNGFVFYGGLIGCIIGVCITCIIKKISITNVLDVFLSLMPLGHAIGRIGCYLNGCCYGKEYTGIGAVDYIVNGNQVKIFPTWFVESVYCFILFIIMFCINRKIYSGIYAAVYLIAYSAFRFFIEYYRGDIIRGIWNGKSTSQYISIVMVVIGMLIGIVCLMRKKDNPMIKERR